MNVYLGFWVRYRLQYKYAITLYTVPKPPCPSLLPIEKLFVASFIWEKSYSENSGLAPPILQIFIAVCIDKYSRRSLNTVCSENNNETFMFFVHVWRKIKCIRYYFMQCWTDENAYLFVVACWSIYGIPKKKWIVLVGNLPRRPRLHCSIGRSVLYLYIHIKFQWNSIFINQWEVMQCVVETSCFCYD